MLAADRSALIRRTWVTLAAMAMLAPVLAWCSVQCVRSMFNTPHLWIPEDDAQRREFDRFVKRFESPAVVIISWTGCTVDDPRLSELESALTDREHSAFQSINAVLFDRVVTGRSALHQMTDPPLELEREEAIERLRGALIGADGETTCAVVVLSERGGYEREAAIDVVIGTASRICGRSANGFFLAGPPVDGVAIDRAGSQTMLRFALPSALVSLAICAWCLRSTAFAAFILAAAAVGEGVCLTIVYVAAIPMNAILILMPPLVFVLTIAAGVHLANYYFAEVKLGGVGAAQRALRAGWGPCLLATFTTAVGLGSLLVSSVEPIRVFGGVATIGVFTTLLLLFLLLPGLMAWRGDHQAAPDRRGPRFESFWMGWSNRVEQWSPGICGLSVLLIIALAAGLLKLQTSVKLRELFSPTDRLLQDYAWLEENVAPMASIEVIVNFTARSSSSFSDRTALVGEVGAAAAEVDSVNGVLSALSFSPPVEPGGGVSQVVRRAVTRSRMKRLRYLDEDDHAQRWRISARAPALTDQDYDSLLSQLRERIEPVVDEFERAAGERVGLTITGAAPIIHQTQQILLIDLIASFAAAFIVIAVVMAILLRSVAAGVLIMIPNVFPTAAVFGLMGWMHWAIDIGSVMTASIALGIAVVDTLHFLSWFRRGVAHGDSARESVRHAFSHCATAMLQTSLICGLGMLVFVFSNFTPASRFAWMVGILLAAALIGDLVILPAMLLLRPLRRVFANAAASRW